MNIERRIAELAKEAARENYHNHEDAKREILDDDTAKSIKACTRKFARWIKEVSPYTVHDLFGGDYEMLRQIIQDYQVYLSKDYRKSNGEHLTVSTVHTYIAYPCTSLGVPMGDIKKDKRTADTIKRSRRKCAHQNRRGDRQENDERYHRLVNFQRGVGIRRRELENLNTEDFVLDESGHYCVRVQNGKCGKEQLQRILPQHEGIVVGTMKVGAPGSRVFSKAEMDNDIDLHAMRAAHAVECYGYYYSRLINEPAYKDTLRRELMARYEVANGGASKKHRAKFIKEVNNDRPYYLRRSGSNYKRAEEAGCPLAYNRLALMAVSVFHLAHWRTDVTVTNYMLGGHK